MKPVIGFAGLSHLGIVSSVAAASKDFRVIAYDPKKSLVDDLKAGRLPLLEAGLAEALKKISSNIQFTSDASGLKECGLLYFSIDIVTDQENQSDPSALMDLINTTASHIRKGSIIVILSQVAPGFTRTLSKMSKIQHTQIFYQVETLIFGQAWERATKPERIIVGSPDPQKELPEVYENFLNAFNCQILKMRYESAELTKISINVCLSASLSAANTLAEICEAIGADWSEIVPALRLDKRIGPHSYLTPGLGIGGGNLERDLVTVKKISAEYGTEGGIADAFLKNSRYRRDWVIRILHQKLFSKITKPTIAVLGLAYKPGTNSIKNSPSLAMIQPLAHVSFRAYDPQVILPQGFLSNAQQVKSVQEASKSADAIVIMTPWEEFSGLSMQELKAQMKGRLIIDPWGVLGSKVISKDISYYRLGVSSEVLENKI